MDRLEQLVDSNPRIEKLVDGMMATEGPTFSRAGFYYYQRYSGQAHHEVGGRPDHSLPHQ